jgi:hypothetical protein
MSEACNVSGRDEKCILMSMKKIILKGFVNIYGEKVRNGLIWIKTWITDSSGEDGSQTLDSLKGEGLCLKSDCFLLEKPCSGIKTCIEMRGMLCT